MQYVSTRGHARGQRFCDILLEGLAPDGGLYLPAHYPRVDDATLTRWRALPYAELAFEILSLYVDDIPAADLRSICRRTFVIPMPAILHPLPHISHHIVKNKVIRLELAYRGSLCVTIIALMCFPINTIL